MFDHFPFLLPNLICAMVLAMGVVIGILFLEETHETKKHRHDVGLEAGRWLLRQFESTSKQTIVIKASQASIEAHAHEILLEDEAPPGYRTTEGSPRQPSSRSQSPITAAADSKAAARRNVMGKSRGVTKAFTRQVILNIAGFGLLA